MSFSLLYTILFLNFSSSSNETRDEIEEGKKRKRKIIRERNNLEIVENYPANVTI